MRIISKVFQARALSTPVVVVNLLEFKQKKLLKESKTLDNGWTISLADSFNINVEEKQVSLPKDQETTQHIVMLKTNKENQKTLFKDIQLVFKLAKKIK